MNWLDDHNIKYEKCGFVANENRIVPYFGQLYIDLPYDKNNEDYMTLERYLENEDGTSRIEHVSFYYLPLEKAIENKHHDEPGFWEKWAERF